MSRRKSRDLSRTLPKREAYKMVLIVCEGIKTETIYFNSLIAYEKLSSVNVQVFAGERSTPSMVVKTAIKIKEAQNKHLAFDEVYCVIDRDSHHSFEEAKQLANKNNITLIVSYPNIEYWYLCHFIYSRAPIIEKGGKSAGDNCEAVLNKEWKKIFNKAYSKTEKDTYILLLPHLENGIKNAKRSLQEAIKEEEYNPSTEVHLLVDNLRKLKS